MIDKYCRVLEKIAIVKLSMKHKSYIEGKQGGFVSIFTVIIIMSILTLLTIGFTTVTQRAQRVTLDNQQNTQAFYAAESGVNDAIRELRTVNPSLVKNDCQTGGSLGAFNYGDLSGSDSFGVSYTCVLVIANPTAQSFDSVPVLGSGEPVVTTLASQTGDNITSVRIAFDSTQVADAVGPTPAGSVFSANDPILPNVSSWGSRVGILRVDLVPVASVDRNSLISNSYSTYLIPNETGSTSINISPGATNQAASFEVICTNTVPRCTGELNLSGATANRFKVRLTSYYKSVRVSSLEIYNGASLLNQIDGQVIIDSTGKSGDILRRIQVAYPLNRSVGYHDPFALNTAGDICKRLLSAPGEILIEADATLYPSCQIN